MHLLRGISTRKTSYLGIGTCLHIGNTYLPIVNSLANFHWQHVTNEINEGLHWKVSTAPNPERPFPMQNSYINLTQDTIDYAR